ncbi:hypothetical protein JDV02_005580 [Purpureocillium takamizusanense]|uniref:Uncharacterized protein n=1 Tax=Purpureocillium takamizusanense TaxID=2060973 RepID=A0A9Q8QGW2_9HYPO|nr:uncharacterized protein JDV02_005580 [Purpureocillium takamizusanense]UNI19395.1 hypothetical protein JDV02_005580 [Purpureocillium takamizusanense]
MGLEDDGSAISGNRKSAESRRFLALAESLVSRVSVPISATVLLAKQDHDASSLGSSEDANLLLVRVTANLFAESALQGLVPGQEVAFHNATGGLGTAGGGARSQRHLYDQR